MPSKSLPASEQLEVIRKQKELLEMREKKIMSRLQNKALTLIATAAKQAGLSTRDILNVLNEAPITQKDIRVGARRSPLAGSKVPSKYRNPDNPSQTWSGRGKAPIWVRDLQSMGKLDTARINHSMLRHV